MQDNKIMILHAIGIMDYGGAETMIMNLYRKLNRNCFQFGFLVHRNREGQFDKEIRKLGGEIYYLPEYKIYNGLEYGKACRLFFQKHAEYDIVHGHIESCAPIYLMEAKRVGMYTIAHCHSTGFEKRIQKLLYNMLTYRTRKTADEFFACSEQAGRNRFGDAVVNSDRFYVFKNGIEIKNYEYSEEKHRKLKIDWGFEDKIVVGHVGRMSKEKNHIFLLNVFSKFCLEINNAVLMLVGDGPEKKVLEERARDLGIYDKVIFAGARNDIPDMMNLFDIFVFPSLYEGLGIALIEAQAAGLPCVVSRAIVKEAIITDSVRQISLQESYEKWAEAVVVMLNKCERKCTVQEVSEAGFDIDDTIKKLENVYSKHREREKITL